MKRALLILGILALVVVTYRVVGVYEFRAGECSALPPRKFATSYPKQLRVMEFNIEGHASLLKSHHIEEIASTISKYHPDIVGINEAHRGTWQARFGDHVNQLGRLTGMNGVFGRSYSFMGGQFGNAILTRGTVVRADVHKLPGTGEPRSVLEAVVKVNGGTIDFYVTHTTAWGSLNATTRDMQLQCLNSHLNASAHPFILVGDLNAAPDTKEIAHFLDGNVMKLAGDPKQPTHKITEKRLDYILTDLGWQVRSARVLDDGPSDHRPLLAELTHP